MHDDDRFDASAAALWDRATLDQVRREAGLAELEFHRSIGSTNDRGLERLRAADWLDPTLILAARQTAGRGRGGNRWWSADGGLTFSLLIRPTIDTGAEAISRSTLRAGLGTARGLASLLAPSAPLTLKWPNDLSLGGRKVAGLLVERDASASGLVIGVGLNVNQRFDEAPEEVRLRGTSPYEFDGRTRDLAEVLIAVIRGLRRELVPPPDAPDDWAERFRARCELTGRIVELEQRGERRTGRCLGIDDGGRLVLETESGRTAIVSGAVVRVVD